MRIVGRLSPLLPDQLLDLLRRGQAQNIIHETGQDLFALSRKIPKGLRDQINTINSPERLNSLYQMIKENDEWGNLSAGLYVTLLEKCGREKETAELYTEMANQAIASGDRVAAYEYYLNVIQILKAHLGKNQNDVLFVSTCLRFCYLYDFFGKFDTSFQKIMDKAVTAAGRVGDRRSEALLKLHLGFYHWLYGQTSKAITILDSGRRIVEELGDEDIQIRSNDFIGVYYYAQGLNKKALACFEKSKFPLTTESGLLHIPTLMAYSAAYTGQFDRAIGHLDYYWQLAKKKGLDSISSEYRVCLGVFLLVINRTGEAIRHIRQALKTAEAGNNELAVYCAELALALYYYKNHQHDEAKNLLDKALTRISTSHLSILTLEPWYIELIYDLEHLGFSPLRGFSFSQVARRILKENNYHYKGVILRLMAQEHLAQGKTQKTVLKYLNESEAYLKMSEDPIQLAKTRINIARVLMSQNEVETAREKAVKARQGLSGRWEDLFPDDLRSLLTEGGKIDIDRRAQDNLIDRFFDMITRLPIAQSLDANLSSLLANMNRLLGADRGAIFLTDEKNRLQLTVFEKLSGSEIGSRKFQSNMALVKKCHREKCPLMALNNPDTLSDLSAHSHKSLICFPLIIDDEQIGVLYHDSFYTADGIKGPDEKNWPACANTFPGM